MIISTGRLISTTCIGDIAKTVDRIKDEYVTRNDSGFYWCDRDGRITLGQDDRFWINDVVSRMSWEIL